MPYFLFASFGTRQDCYALFVSELFTVQVYKYDVLADFIDLSGKQDKLPVTGAANRGVYVSAAGVVSGMSHTLDKDVPADAALRSCIRPVRKPCKREAKEV